MVGSVLVAIDATPPTSFNAIIVARKIPSTRKTGNASPVRVIINPVWLVPNGW